VTFTVEAPAANEICVVGDFNGWKVSEESRLARVETGRWEKRLRLPHGRYRYKFVIDGEWKTDAKNQEREGNEFGTFNSVMRI
jgi:1,4-alpha-glucan branching enzyme